MIVILCENFQEAMDAYDLFVMLLEETEPWSIVSANNHALRVKTEYDLLYIFTERYLMPAFEGKTPDIMDVDEFFEGLPDTCYGVRYPWKEISE